MSEPFLAEVKIVGFNFPPRGYAQCDGQILPINQNQSLYSLLGTTYGGDGRTTFGLPDLRGRTPIHANGNHPLGQKGGAQDVTLTVNQIPSHTHTVSASINPASTNSPANNVLGLAPQNIYNNTADSPLVDVANESNSMNTTNTGGNQAHTNEQPYLVLNYVIATQGLFPSRN